MKMTKESVASAAKDLPKMAVNFVIRLLFFSPVALVIGMAFGMRMFETGQVLNIAGRSLKGITVRVSGVCKIGDRDRLPALTDDQVTITSMNDKTVTGVVRKTREAISCNLSEIAIDSLPMLADFQNNPAPPPEVTPAKAPEAPAWGLDLVNRIFKVSGPCQNTISGGTESLLDTLVVFTSAKKKSGSEGGTILGVIRSEGRMKGTVIQCESTSISYEPAVLEEPKPEVAVAPPEEDLRGKYIVVTSTCFPDHKFKEKKDENLFYNFINEKIQVTDYQKVNGKLEWLSGAFVGKGVMIECDSKRYPITWRLFDPSTMTLNPVSKTK